MLTFSIPGQRIQTIAGRNPQVAELISGLQRFKFPPSYRKYLNRKALRAKPVKDCLRDFVLEAADHNPSLQTCFFVSL